MVMIARTKAGRMMRCIFVALLRNGDERKHHHMRYYSSLLFLPHLQLHALPCCLSQRLVLHNVAVDVEESPILLPDELAFAEKALASHAAASQHQRAIAACLCDYLQVHRGLSFKDAVAISTNVPAFIEKIAASASDEQADSEVSTANIKAHFETTLKNEGVNECELLLESIGVPCKKFGEVLSAFTPDVRSRRDLLHIVAVLEDIGIPRKKVWNLIRRENKLTQVSVEEIASNLQTLEDFGVKKKHFRQVVQRCPSILLGDLKEVLSPLVHQLEELGVDYNQIISHNLEYNSQRVIFSGATKLQELRNIYLQHGLSIPELAKALRRYPRLLAFVSESNWTKSVEYLKGLSLGDNDFGQLIKRNPPLLTCSIQSNLKLKIDFLASIGVSKDNLPRILKRCPTLFCCSIEQNLKPKMKYLQSVGMQGNDLGKIVTLRPSILGRSLTKGFSEKVKFLIVLGFETGSPQFVRALGCLFSASLDTLESRMKQLGELGFTLSEIFLMVKRNPNLLSTSNKQFQAKIEFLMNIMEYSLKDLVSYPVYFNLNLQGRIIPRHRVLSWLRSHGKLNKSSSLSYIVALSEKRFQAKFIETYPGCRDVYEGLKTMEPLVSSA